jgi:LSD1 subclass zinc finger protein
MSALDERRLQDVRKLQDLASRSGGKITITSATGNPINRVTVELRYITAPSGRYPEIKTSHTTLVIDLLARYPLQAPSATIKTPIFHPNVYPSGQICLGGKWLPTESLDLLVKRIIQIVTFDPSVLNETSPANGGALQWYRQTIARYPGAFPTERAVFEAAAEDKKIVWKDAVPSHVIVKCPGCPQQLRVPSGKEGRVRCPSCGTTFEART